MLELAPGGPISDGESRRFPPSHGIRTVSGVFLQTMAVTLLRRKKNARRLRMRRVGRAADGRIQHSFRRAYREGRTATVRGIPSSSEVSHDKSTYVGTLPSFAKSLGEDMAQQWHQRNQRLIDVRYRREAN